MDRELTAREIAISDNGPSFATVSAADIFSPTGNYALGARIMRENPRRYFELKREYDFEIGVRLRPSSYYDAK